MKLIRTEDAVGHVLCHDMTQIIKDQYKDARFRKGHIVTEDDIPVLLSMGKENLYVWEMTPGMVHENDAAERLLALCGQENMVRSETKEGKIELRAACDGLFRVDSRRLVAVNSLEEIMIATRHGNTAVKKGDKLAGMRVIPLIIKEETLQAAEQAAGAGPLLELLPYVKKTAAIVATGSEVKNLHERAVSYARRFRRRNQDAWLNSYEFDYNPSHWKIRRFDSYDGDWLEFISNCRAGNDGTDYDMVIGGVADDKVIRTLDRYFEGEITAEHALGILIYEKPNIQYCIRSQAMLNECLNHLESKQI